MDILKAFPCALQKLRQARLIESKDLQAAISYSYLRHVERGLKSPTLRKVEMVAHELGVKPLTLLLATYAEVNPDVPLQDQVGLALQKLSALGQPAATEQDDSPP